jgi:outer membrane receptor for ferrienterochelin and colicin
LNNYVVGNPDLQLTTINNYDIRLEDYFKNGDNISVSVFYKDFTNLIELTLNSNHDFIWLNNPNYSYVEGIEVEGKKTLTNHFDFRANLTFANSHSTFQLPAKFNNGVQGETVSHTMFGQAPYVINGSLVYHADSAGLTVALSYNVQGARLVIDGNSGIPDIYELPRNLLDCKISKTLGKHFAISFKVNDILDAPVVRAYKFPQGFKADFDKYNWGTNYIFSAAYKL